MSSGLNRYWIPHHEIHRRIITQELQYYLGPEATVRPYTLEGEDGFLISTPGACLTDEQIDDICHKSKESSFPALVVLQRVGERIDGIITLVADFRKTKQHGHGTKVTIKG
ncbi:hypothetical protein CDD82_4452 [Ophiocordyceps australis]|uniref:Uncharacterized protein n=1 Tax=Ophiocordyceps australis TaxID=1399860 RepID=A0A2C5XKE1_9HYPO|nr:hypothetical protein CDD82_4452 [Ophiocordyceps australis]